MNLLYMKAIRSHNALKNYDPWKSIEKMWQKNRKVRAEELRCKVATKIEIAADQMIPAAISASRGSLGARLSENAVAP